MKLLRYGTAGVERPGLLDDTGTIRDLSAVVSDISGDTLDQNTLAKIAALDPATLPAVDGGERISPCVANVGKFICIGLNYTEDTMELGIEGLGVQRQQVKPSL